MLEALSVFIVDDVLGGSAADAGQGGCGRDGAKEGLDGGVEVSLVAEVLLPDGVGRSRARLSVWQKRKGRARC